MAIPSSSQILGIYKVYGSMPMAVGFSPPPESPMMADGTRIFYFRDTRNWCNQRLRTLIQAPFQYHYKFVRREFIGDIVWEMGDMTRIDKFYVDLRIIVKLHRYLVG